MAIKKREKIMIRLIIWLIAMAVPFAIICSFLNFLGNLMIASIKLY